MALGVWALLEAGLLVLNAICVLHEQRFLQKVGWGVGAQTQHVGFGSDVGGAAGSSGSVKTQILNIIHSTRTVMRIPLIFVNSVVIAWKLVLG